MPYRYPTDQTAAQVRATHADLAPDVRTTDRVRVAGRLDLIRRQGGLTFGVLRDRTGAVQLFVDTAVLGEAAHHEFDDLDRGDWVGGEGRAMTTRRGELSIAVESFALLGKALLEAPDKHRGLTDVETRYRQRYVDLAANARTRDIFRIRHTAIRSIRRYLEDQGFTEVEGPVLQTIQGGASARPFVTHHNALGLDMYLRVALELHLKRLIVGGMERVFEIGRVCRNEGIDTRHNPEFTMLEAYQAYADYHDMMDLVEGMIKNAATDAIGGDLVVRYGGRAIDLAPTWPRVRFDMIAEKTGGDRAGRARRAPAVDELRDVGPAVRRRHPVHGHPTRRPLGGRRAQPVLPDQVAARLQRQVRAGMAAAGARLPPPDRPAPGGLPTPAPRGSWPCGASASSSCRRPSAGSPRRRHAAPDHRPVARRDRAPPERCPRPRPSALRWNLTDLLRGRAG